MAKFPLIDLAYGKYITLLISNKENQATLPHRTSIKVKARNQIGKATLLTDIPEGALRYVYPKHPNQPQQGNYILFAGPGGVSVLGNEINVIRGDVFEKLTQAQNNAEAAQVAKEIESQMQLETSKETVAKQIDIAKDIKESQQMFFPDYDFRKKADELIGK